MKMYPWSIHLRKLNRLVNGNRILLLTKGKRNFRVHQLSWEHCWPALDSRCSLFWHKLLYRKGLALSLYLIQLMHSIMQYKNSLFPKPKFLCRYIFTFHIWRLQCYRTNKKQFESMSSKKSPYFSLLAMLARKEKNTVGGGGKLSLNFKSLA